MFSPMVATSFLDLRLDRDLRAGIGRGEQLREIALGRRGERGDVAHHVLELLVAGDEVGLRVDLDDGARLALGDDADEALGGDAVRLLGGLRQALLAQPVDGRFDVALGLGQRRLAVHHAGAGLVAQLLHAAAVIVVICHLIAGSRRRQGRLRIDNDAIRRFRRASPLSSRVLDGGRLDELLGLRRPSLPRSIWPLSFSWRSRAPTARRRDRRSARSGRRRRR